MEHDLKKLSLGDKLKLLMELKKMSRDALAQFLGVSPTGLDDWIAGKKHPIGLVEKNANCLLREHGTQSEPFWACLSYEYEQEHGEPPPRKDERQKKKRKDGNV